MKIERLLAITVLLLNSKRVRAKDLAERFEVSIRTIYRDFETLKGAGIPVVSEQGFEGGFYLPASYTLNRQLLTFNDIVSLLTTLQGINATLKNDDIMGVIEKITALIPTDKKEQYAIRSNSFIVDIGGWGGPGKLDDLIEIFHRAIGDQRVVAIDYVSAKGDKSNRKVEPYALIFKAFSWYIVGYCRLRSSFRLFRLSRVRHVKIEVASFIRKEVDVRDVCNHNDKGETLTCTLKFPATMQNRVEEYFSDTDILITANGDFVVELQMREDEWLYSFILSFGESVEVVSPLSLRKTINYKIDKMRIVYRDLT